MEMYCICQSYHIEDILFFLYFIFHFMITYFVNFTPELEVSLTYNS